jgi:SAM-dependent methyltransferase
VTGPTDAERARSFGSIATHYDRFRPAPPAEAVTWTLPERCGRAVDLGAGTGALTRQLVTRVAEVLALEPDARMRTVLRLRAPAAAVVGAVGEALPLADATADVVMVSSAWHWMDPARAVPEVARVLRPGGVFGVMGNSPSSEVPWVAEVLQRPPPPERGPESLRARYAAGLPDGAPFGPPDTTVITWTAAMTRDELVGLAGTYSRVVTLPDDERQALLERVVEAARRHPALGREDRVAVPMRCRCWRAVRA